MKRTVIGAALLVLGMGLLPSAHAYAQDECPAVAADGRGVERIEGQGSYSFYGIPTEIVDQPVMALIDDGLAAKGDRESLPSNAGQVLGVITSDFFSTPFSYTINLPFTGSGLQVDLDQNDSTDTGVQVYEVALAQNMLNTVPLTGISQGAVLSSYYRDSLTQEIVKGALVVYAPDDMQGFPCGYGADGKLFTADDPIVTLPQGFTVANIDNGTITFDRSQVAKVNVADPPGGATLDFSDQGIAESFDTLIDFLKERYVFTEFYDIDWDALKTTYLPRVKQADADANLAEYYLVLLDLAHDLTDPHVYVQPGAIFADPKALEEVKAGVPKLWGGLQAGVVELNDGRIIVTSVTPGGPAAGAGFEFGTEILSVDGVPVDEILAQPLRTLEFPGTAEAKRMLNVNHLLSHAPGTEVEVGYQQPGATEVMTAVLTAVPDVRKKAEESLMPLEYKMVDGVGYVTWPGFERTGIATHIFADFIKVMNEKQVPGIIIDLRGNGGGSNFMQFAIMSYLFGEDKPLDIGVADNYTYSQLAGKFNRTPATMKLFSPPNEHPYLGDVVVLVDDQCASACEFMSYYLKANARATIVGQYATEGAGGSTNAVYLPGMIQLNYSASTIVDDKTNQPAFQAIGVQPDVRVPVTEETERLKQEGGDPVLDAGIAHLRRLALQRLDLQPAPFASGTITTVVPTNWRPKAAGDGYSSPDLPISLTIQPWTATADTDPDAIMLDVSPDVRKASDLETDTGTWSVYAAKLVDGEKVSYRVYGVLVRDGQPYVVTATTPDENLVSLIVEYIFVPALQSFEVSQ
ncbi:MAG: S41 family peptidase [Caldilineaceae bacterium]